MTISESAKLEDALSNAFYALHSLTVMCERTHGYNENVTLQSFVQSLQGPKNDILSIRDRIHF